MAHRSLWLTVWGIVLVCVTVPHASCQPTPGTSHHEMMPYYKHAQEPNHYYPTFEDEEENSAKDRTNLQDSEHLIEESTVAHIAEITGTVVSRPEILEGPREVSPAVDNSINTYILLFELVGAIYFAWALIYPVLPDTSSLSLEDILGNLQFTSESVPEMSSVLNKNSTLNTPSELTFNKKKKNKNDGVKPLRMFDTISNHKKKSKKSNSTEQHEDVFKSLSWIFEAVSNFTNLSTRTKRESNYDLLSRFLRLDPVDIALNLLRIEDGPNSKCRERLVCDARYLASTIPYVDDYLPHANSREDFNPVFKYEEAAFIGSQKKDCSTFSCPKTSIQLLTGGL